jgi:PAS domain-containing protein
VGAVAVREGDPCDLVETVREGLLVLDSDLTVRFANRSFCDTFAVASEDAVVRKLYEFGNSQWTFPNSAQLSRPSFLAENPSRPSKLSGSSRQSAGA